MIYEKDPEAVCPHCGVMLHKTVDGDRWGFCRRHGLVAGQTEEAQV